MVNFEYNFLTKITDDKHKTIRTTIKDNNCLINIIKRPINGCKGRDRPKKTFITEMIKLASGDIYQIYRRKERMMEKNLCNKKT